MTYVSIDSSKQLFNIIMQIKMASIIGEQNGF